MNTRLIGETKIHTKITTGDLSTRGLKERERCIRTLALSWAMIFMRSASMVPSFFSDSSTSSGRTTFDDDPILRLRLLHPQITHYRYAPRPPKFSNPGCFGPTGESTLPAGTLAGDPSRSPKTEARVRFLSLVTGREGRREEHALRSPHFN
jgi:hypothetical protein